MTEGNNFSRANSELRDAFMTDSEIEYFESLMNDEMTGAYERRIHDELLGRKADELCATVRRLIERVDRGEFTQEEMEYVEYVIAHCLSAVKDAENVNALEKEPDEDAFEEIER